MALDIDMDGVEESAGGGTQALPNGTYVLKVLKVGFQPKDQWGNDQTWMDLVWDVAEGEHAGCMADRPEFTHSVRVSFDPKRLGLTKHMLNCISRSNPGSGDRPGFNAIEAWKRVCDPSDRYHQQAVRAFEGKLFGGGVVTYHSPNNGKTKDRYPDNTKPMVWTWYDADEARTGRTKDGKAIEVLPDQWRRGWSREQAEAAAATSAPGTQADASDVYDDDVPF